MAQDNTARKDTSMDDILSSIRRIIDESEARKANAPDGPSAPANDIAPTVPQQGAAAFRAHPLAASESDASSLESVLAKLEAEMQRPEPEPQTSAPVAEKPNVADHQSMVRAEKYEARFSEEDSRAFATLGDVLAEQAAAPEAKPLAPAPNSVAAKVVADEPAHVVAAREPAPEQQKTDQQSVAVFEPTVAHLEKLVSEPVAKAVALSFGNLEEILSRHSGQSLTEVTQTMLKPMLQDWLDENLPSMVERMVRGEIERIARGEPRQG